MLKVLIGTAVVFIIGLIVFFIWFGPQYNVYSQTLEGEAQLKKAQYTRQIAELDAAAEVAKARGVAQANQIVADGLGGPEGYLRYLWIEKVAGSSNQIIYLPADGGMPILEAARSQAAH